MPRFYTKLINEPNPGPPPNGFWHDAELALFKLDFAEDKQAINALVYKVRRNPQNLHAHLRRIYFCHQNAWSVQLYAALLDFFIILQGKGAAISQRMLSGSRRRLDEHQYWVLRHSGNDDYPRLGNSYTLFTTGRVGVPELLRTQQKSKTQHDFLALANDFIEYSQLDEAMDVLEIGISFYPERQDLQETLLQLYQLTENRDRLIGFYQKMSKTHKLLDEEWRATAKMLIGSSQ